MQHNQSSRFERMVSCTMLLINMPDQIVQGAAPGPFSYGMGVVSPPLFASSLCRHPLLHRKTIGLLRRAPKRETLFAADVNARAIERALELEERLGLAQAVKNRTWNGCQPSEEMRWAYIPIHCENTNGRRAKPSLRHVRGISRSIDGKVEMSVQTMSLF